MKSRPQHRRRPLVEEIEPRVVKAVRDATDHPIDLFVLSGVPAPIAPLPWLMAPLGNGADGAVVATGAYGKAYRVLLPPPQLPVTRRCTGNTCQ